MGPQSGPQSLGLGLHAATPAPPLAYPTPDSGMDEVRDVRVRLAETERRLVRTERALADLEARFSSSRAEAEPEIEDASIVFAGPLRLSALQLEGHDETLWSVACTRRYPDPVGRGLLSPAEAELVWHGFKARAARLLPIPPFTAVSTPVPEHGFVTLAALHHVPALIKDQGALRRMVDESIGLAMASHASVDVVLALLILSIAPPLPDDGGESAPTNPTAWRMLSLARSMCVSMGLESRAIAAQRRGTGLNDQAWADSLWILQLVSTRMASSLRALTTVVRRIQPLRNPFPHVSSGAAAAAARTQPPPPTARTARGRQYPSPRRSRHRRRVHALRRPP